MFTAGKLSEGTRRSPYISPKLSCKLEEDFREGYNVSECVKVLRERQSDYIKFHSVGLYGRVLKFELNPPSSQYY